MARKNRTLVLSLGNYICLNFNKLKRSESKSTERGNTNTPLSVQTPRNLSTATIVCGLQRTLFLVFRSYALPRRFLSVICFFVQPIHISHLAAPSNESPHPNSGNFSQPGELIGLKSVTAVFSFRMNIFSSVSLDWVVVETFHQVLFCKEYKGLSK